MWCEMKYFISNITNRKFLKGIAIFMLGQAVGYYSIKLFLTDYHIIGSQIDNSIPFVPHMIYFYSLFYLYIFFTLYYIFIKDYNNYKKGIIIGTIIYIIADIIFLIYPTIMIRPEVAYDKLDWLTAFLVKTTYTYDNPASNCFPSIHCLFCFQVIIMTIMLKNVKWTNKALIIIIGLLISISTVFVKQHYLYDVIGALILSITMNTLGYVYFNKIIKSS